jgi:hypothetical protein
VCIFSEYALNLPTNRFLVVFRQPSMFIKIGSLVHLMCTRENKTQSHTQRNFAQFKNCIIIHVESLHGITHNNVFYLLISITFFCYNKEGSLENLKLFHCVLPWMIPPRLIACICHCHSKILTLEAKSKC